MHKPLDIDADRLQQQNALRESEERFRQLADNIQEVFYIFDLVTMSMLYISPSYAVVWGRSCESLMVNPLSYQEAVDPADRHLITEALTHQVQGDRTDNHYMIHQPDGSVRYIHDRGFPLKDASGKVYRVVGIAEDVTERRRLERQTLQSDKMAAVGLLAAGISHEINNPLGVILGFAQALMHRRDSLDPEYSALAAIAREALRCRTLVQNLLLFSRERKPGMLPEDPVAALTGALALVESQARLKQVTINQEFPADLPKVLMDIHQIQQVVINLATNAIDAMPDGGVLTVKLKRESETLTIRVSDTGTGIPAEVRSRIFEPFFTTKPIGKGTGLGLSLVYELVQKHHGRIDVETDVHKGTTFTVHLPLELCSRPSL